MVKIYLKFDQDIPQYACSSCSNCSSVFGKSLCSIKDRGCCWYFPKFTLHDIHKMTKSEEGLKILDKILTLPEVKVYNYYIHAKGYFDEIGYKKYMESRQSNQYAVQDKSIFFRACPFIKPGSGCTLPVKYRSYVCNFYICDEILSEACKYDGFEAYLKERSSYVKWVEWENRSLEHLLEERGLNLVNNFHEIIGVLKDIPLDNYEFPQLKPIEIIAEYNVGA